jgi:radical SAM superfamily enzyme YgiQ (UPF0313 family)
MRQRSPSGVVDWLVNLRAAGFRNFTFVDNTFNLPISYAKELCRKIIAASLDIRFWCIIYPKWVDAELVRLLKTAGCSQVSLGFESGSDTVLRALNKRFDQREIRRISELFTDAGIPQSGFLLLGGPGETRGTVEESLALAASLHLEMLKITVGIRIYPNTRLAQISQGEQVIAAGDDLLQPRFYLAHQLREWLPARVGAYRESAQ